MNALMIGLFVLSGPVLAGPADDCVNGAHSWFDSLASEGCPVLDKFRTAAVKGCREMPEEGWTRPMKSARKAILDDCKPNKKGFPGSHAQLPDGTTSSRCSELIKLVQNVEGNAPAEPAWGIDHMMAAVSTGVFVCHAPDDLDLCLLSSQIQTPTGQIEQRREACAGPTPGSVLPAGRDRRAGRVDVGPHARSVPSLGSRGSRCACHIRSRR